jgi:hypothetical protein
MRDEKDEKYIIKLCNRVLGSEAKTQHRFDFLRGDKAERVKVNGKCIIKEVIEGAGVPLPVDAYYEKLNLVIEYHERQHFEPVKFFDKPGTLTVSGVNRGEQRKKYDQRRRDVLREKNICLIEFYCTDFKLRGKGKLKRDEKNDESIIREKLSEISNNRQ